MSASPKLLLLLDRELPMSMKPICEGDRGDSGAMVICPVVQEECVQRVRMCLVAPVSIEG